MATDTDPKKLPTNFPRQKFILLAVLCVIALAVTMHGYITRRRHAGQITAVQSIAPLAEEAMINCPACKHQFSDAESAAVSAPNMRNCPKCQRQVPLSYFLRQQRQKKK